MAKKKYYAVKSGRCPGIYTTWAECKAQVDGYSGAQFKSFPEEEPAAAYINGSQSDGSQLNGPQSDGPQLGGSQLNGSQLNGSQAGGEDSPGEAVARIYVDGSYRCDTQEFSYGMVVLQDKEEHCFSKKMQDDGLAQMHNVAGEIMGARAAMEYAVEHEIPHIVIYHDYEGIARWCTGEWAAKKPGTAAYKEFYDNIRKKLQVEFVKVTGHSNDKYNDMADELAKEALGLRPSAER